MPLPPKDWPRVDDVFEGARALPADRRPAYLAERCGGDEALRQEVESLLAWDARAESVFATPVLVDGYWPYDVSPDGQRFLVNTLDGAVAPLTIVVNWPAGLQR